MKQFPLSIVLLNPNKYFLVSLAQLFDSIKLPKQDLSHLTGSQLRCNSLAIAIPKGYNGSDIDKYLEKHWAYIIETQLAAFAEYSKIFPKDMSFKETEHWFDRELHPMLYWLSADGDELDKNQNIMATIVAPNEQLTSWVGLNREHLHVNIPENSSLSHEAMLKHSNVYLSASIQNPIRLKQAFHIFSEDILSNEFSMWTTKVEVWPEQLDARCFDQFFTIEPHYQLLTLT